MNSKQELITFFMLNEQEKRKSFLQKTDDQSQIQSKNFAVGNGHIVLLNDNGTVTALGDNMYGQCNVSLWRDISKVAAGDYCTVGLKTNGTVLAVGDNTYGQCNVSLWKEITDVFVINNATVGVEANGDLIISSRLSESDFEYKVLDDESIEITSYCGTIECVSIPRTINGKIVTSIGDSAFIYDEYVKYVSIPDSVLNVGESAFKCCEKLERIIIPKSVTSLGKFAFYSCKNLKEVSISWTLIESYDLSTDFDVLSIWFDNTHDQPILISGNYYYGCKDENRFTLYEQEYAAIIDVRSKSDWNRIYNTKTQDDGTIKICGFNIEYENMVIPESILGKPVTCIGNMAFFECKMKSITIPETVTVIGQEAFKNCKNLTEIVLPNSVGRIELGVFYGCSNLKRVKLSNSLQRIPTEAFCYCESLEKIDLPNSISSIGKDAFKHCSKLYSIEIPNSVQSIAYDAFDSRTQIIRVICTF